MTTQYIAVTSFTGTTFHQVRGTDSQRLDQAMALATRVDGTYTFDRNKIKELAMANMADKEATRRRMAANQH